MDQDISHSDSALLHTMYDLMEHGQMRQALELLNNEREIAKSAVLSNFRYRAVQIKSTTTSPEVIAAIKKLLTDA